MNCSKSLGSRPSQIQTLRGSFAFYGSFFGRIAGAFECFATSVRFEGVLATRLIIRIATPGLHPGGEADRLYRRRQTQDFANRNRLTAGNALSQKSVARETAK